VPEPEHPELIQPGMEVLERLRRIYSRTKRVARGFVPKEVASNA
jgi:hypothetical protein